MAKTPLDKIDPEKMGEAFFKPRKKFGYVRNVRDLEYSDLNKLKFVHKRIRKRYSKKDEVEGLLIYVNKKLMYDAYQRLMALGMTPQHLFHQMLSLIVDNDPVVTEEFLKYCRASFSQTMNRKARGKLSHYKRTVLNKQLMPAESYKDPEDRILSEEELKELYDFYNKDTFQEDEEYLFEFEMKKKKDNK
jgi:hypothetical protein